MALTIRDERIINEIKKIQAEKPFLKSASKTIFYAVDQILDTEKNLEYYRKKTEELSRHLSRIKDEQEKIKHAKKALDDLINQ